MAKRGRSVFSEALRRRAKRLSEENDPKLGFDPERETARGWSRKAVANRLNRLATVLDVAFEELSALRHELHVAESYTDTARRMSSRGEE